MAHIAPSAGAAPRWAKVVDHESCIGCHACTTACKSENEVPLGVTRTYVKYADVGFFPQTRRAFQVTRCNQCEDAPCTVACPTAAMYKRPDGIVDFDKKACIGCKACIAACPYDAIFINPEDGNAEKCNFCAHRIDLGLEPACVVVCPTEALLVGDMDDPESRVSQIVHREPVTVRRPEKETHPKVFYRGAHQATLDPLAAARPEGGLFLWSEQQDGPHKVVSGHPDGANSSAAAVLSYDVGHSAPWDWRVSLYTLTKGIASGVYLVSLLLLLLGRIGTGSPLWTWVTPVVSGAFLALTGLLLLWDLEHPGRFWMIFTRPQWKSWLTRGAFVISGYGLALGGHFLSTHLGSGSLARALIWAGLPLAVGTAVYTAYLFAQAKARDLWQNPLLPPHLLVQAVFSGAALLTPVAALVEPGTVITLLGIAGIAGILHLLLVAGEFTLPHATAHARLAANEAVRGRYRGWFWASIVLVVAAVLTPLLGAGSSWLASCSMTFLALAGLGAFEHAYVQAGQSVPLA